MKKSLRSFFVIITALLLFMFILAVYFVPKSMGKLPDALKQSKLDLSKTLNDVQGKEYGANGEKLKQVMKKRP